MEHRSGRFPGLVCEMKPATVRRIFHLATVRGIVEKTETGYVKVQRGLVKLRRDGLPPFTAWSSAVTARSRQSRGIDVAFAQRHAAK